MLGLFVNTLTVDDKYSSHESQNFPQQIQMILSQKLKTFSHFSQPFWKLHQILSIFKKDMIHSLNISEIIDPKRGGYLNV